MMTVSFTAHRPNRLGGYTWVNSKNIRIMNKIEEVIVSIIENNPNETFHFISGAAIGGDQMAFHIIDALKRKYPQIIHNQLAIPCKYIYNNWSKEDQNRHFEHIAKATIVTYVDITAPYCMFPPEIYHVNKLFNRNMYMINNADLMIALWDGKGKSGTYSTVKNTLRKKKGIISIHPDTLEIDFLNMSNKLIKGE